MNQSFLEIKNPKAALEGSFKHLSCLTVGQFIPFQYGDLNFEIEVMDLKPSNAVSVIETDCEVEFTIPDWWNTNQTNSNQKIEDNFQWLKRMPAGGVRVYDEGFNRMVREGRVPGVKEVKNQ